VTFDVALAGRVAATVRTALRTDARRTRRYAAEFRLTRTVSRRFAVVVRYARRLTTRANVAVATPARRVGSVAVT
jgi:hypothetical protein